MREANELAESIGLDKYTILAAAKENLDSAEMTFQANWPPFSAEDNTNTRVGFDNILKFKDSMK